MRHKGTRGKTDKRRSEGERKRRVSRRDYVFMNVPRPTGEMGAVPGIFSRPPSMACPRLVKSGFYWMDTHTHGHTHTHTRRGRVLRQCWSGRTRTAELQWSYDTKAQHFATITEGVAACLFAWCASDWVCVSSKWVSIFISGRTGGIGCGVYGHAGNGCAPAHIQYVYMNFLPKHCT